MVHLRLFAALREELLTDRETIDLPADVTTVGAAREFLCARSEQWRAALSEPRIRAALNHQVATELMQLEEGSELAFFPPVTGG